MSISVEPLLQGHGIGRILVSTFMEECRSRGCTHVNLTTDAVNNSETNTFYHQLGFELRQSFTTPEGRIMNEYVIPLIQSD
jgi:GNAT superfamily N-acetyltransferase